jgi:hypothetical protein
MEHMHTKRTARARESGHKQSHSHKARVQQTAAGARAYRNSNGRRFDSVTPLDRDPHLSEDEQALFDELCERGEQRRTS